jgi:hypothetical protein
VSLHAQVESEVLEATWLHVPQLSEDTEQVLHLNEHGSQTLFFSKYPGLHAHGGEVALLAPTTQVKQVLAAEQFMQG